jgi:Tfp pilus assembly protein PilN
MKQINLLPLSIRRASAQRKLIPAAVIGLVLGAVLVGGSWFVLQQENTSLTTQVASATALKQQRVDQLEKERNANKVDETLKQRVDQLNTLSKNEIHWTQVFAQINSLINKDLKITTLSATQADPLSVGIKYGGDAPSNVSFASFIKALQNNASLQEMKIDTYSYAPSTGKVTFAISYKIPVTSVLYQAPASK